MTHRAIPRRPDRRLLRGRWVDEISRHRLIGLRRTAAHRMGQVSRAQDADRGRPGRRCARGDRADAVGDGGDGFPAAATCWRSAGSASATTPWTWRRVPQADVVVFITAGAVDRSVAEATVGWMIALTHHFRIKDQLGAHRPLGRAIEVHGPRAARPDVWRDRPGRDRPGHRGLAPRVRHEDAAGV